MIIPYLDTLRLSVLAITTIELGPEISLQNAVASVMSTSIPAFLSSIATDRTYSRTYVPSCQPDNKLPAPVMSRVGSSFATVMSPD